VDQWVIDELKKLKEEKHERNREIINQGYLPFLF